MVKKCKQCGLYKDISEFYPNGYNRKGERKYRPKCRKCEGVDKPRKPKAETKLVDGTLYKKCVKCLKWKNAGECFDGNRSTCKECRKEEHRELRQKQKETDFIFYKCREMARDAYARVTAPSRAHKANYRRLENPFGFKSPRDMCEFLYKHFYSDIEHLLSQGKRPTVDRIDANKGYTPDNIRVIDFKENTLRGVQSRKKSVKVTFPDGDVRVYESVTACAEDFGTNVSHIRGWITGKWTPKNGCKFEYA